MPQDVDQSRQKRDAQSFVRDLGRALHRYGTPVHRLERALDEVSQSLDLKARFFATPTVMFSDFEGDASHGARFERQNAGEVDLGKLAEIDELAQAVIRRDVTAREGSVAIERVVGRGDHYATWLNVLCFGLTSAGFAMLLGGGPSEVLASLVCGVVAGFLAWIMGQGDSSRLFELVGALVVSSIATSASHSIGFNSSTVVLAGLIVLVPGLTVTLAFTELAQGSLVSGTARLFGAILVFLWLGIGVSLGRVLSEAIFGPAPMIRPQALPEWTPWLAVLVCALSFTVLFRASARDLTPIAGLSFAVFLVSSLSTPWLGPVAAAFSGSFVVALGSNAWARLRRRPALILRVPTLIILVPGSLGYRAVEMFSTNDALQGLQFVFTMALVAVALASGLMAGGALLPPRQRL